MYRTFNVTRPIVLILSISLLGCGILGKKNEPPRTFANQEGGCLDNIGDQASSYIDGEITAAEWNEVFSCVDQQLDTFERFVRPETPAGYSVKDLTGLIRDFLIRTKPVSDDLTVSILRFKASFIGGDAERLKPSELQNLRAFLSAIRSASSEFLAPYQASIRSPSPANFLALLTAFEAAAHQIATSLSTTGNSAFTEEHARMFMRTLSTMGYSFDLPNAEAWVSFMTRGKFLLVRGNTLGIQGTDWVELFKLAGSLGGAAYIFMKDSASDGIVGLSLTQRLEAVLNQVLVRWSGNIRFDQMDQIISAAPDSFLTGQKELFRTGLRALLKSQNSQPPAIAVLMGSRNIAGLDRFAVSTIVDLFRRGYLAHVLAANVFQNRYDLALAPSTVATRAQSLAQHTPSQEYRTGYARLATLATRYPGYFRPNESLIWFGDQSKHYVTNLRKLSWYEITSERLLAAYGSRANSFGMAGTVNDLKKLVNDVYTLLLSISMIHPDKSDIHKKRFREINLFTSMGDGDELADVRETTAYLAQLLSTTPLSREMQNDLFQNEIGEASGLCPKVGMDMKLFLPQFEITCFRRGFESRIPVYFRNAPAFVTEYQSSGVANKSRFMEVFEEASKFSGFDNLPVTKYDVASYSGIPTLAETAFMKFDKRGGIANQRIDRFEALEYAFPVFKRELGTITGINIDILNQALLLYLLQKGRSPLRCISSPTASEIADLVSWLVGGGPFQDFQAPRLRVYEIFAALGSVGDASCGGSKSKAIGESDEEIFPISESPYQPALPYLPDSL